MTSANGGESREDLVAAIDQGTTGTTVLLVDGRNVIVGRGYAEVPQIYPQPGWVEHNPEDIWRSVCTAWTQARRGNEARSIAALGLTNQRETVVVWDRKSGAPLHNAIVWQDRRTAPACEALKGQGHETFVQERTGLIFDPYFSASKIGWIVDSEGLRMRAQRGEVVAGTIDSFLIHKLTGGTRHLSDVSNASRTQLMDIHTLQWSDTLCGIFDIPPRMLPELVPCMGIMATCGDALPGLRGVPIAGCAGDQQAALFGQNCVQPGDAKCTFGTGSFLLMNTGHQAPVSRSRLLTTVAWTHESTRDKPTYALEGGAFVCGALVQWLRDGLGLINSAAEVEQLARTVTDAGGVTIVPAFTGLGAPTWAPDARGTIFGLTRGCTKAHIARAALDAMAMQNVDIADAMQRDAATPIARLRVDGGASANNLLMQIQADRLGVPLQRPAQVESTALGAARMAAVGAGLASMTEAGPDDATKRLPVEEFTPMSSQEERDAHLVAWRQAIARTIA